MNHWRKDELRLGRSKVELMQGKKRENKYLMAIKMHIFPSAEINWVIVLLKALFSFVESNKNPTEASYSPFLNYLLTSKSNQNNQINLAPSIKSTAARFAVADHGHIWHFGRKKGRANHSSWFLWHRLGEGRGEPMQGCLMELQWWCNYLPASESWNCFTVWG